jgi:hypothetical protein
MNASHWIWSGQAIGYTKISITAVIPNRAATLARSSAWLEFAWVMMAAPGQLCGWP